MVMLFIHMITCFLMFVFIHVERIRSRQSSEGLFCLQAAGELISFSFLVSFNQAESPEGGAVEQDGGELLVRVKFSSNNQGELLRLSSLKCLQEKDTRLSVRRII